MSGVLQLGRELARGVLDLVFAPTCLGCGEPIATSASERRVCAVCWSRCLPLAPPRCDRCWGSFPASYPLLGLAVSCTVCAELPPALRAVRSAFVYQGPARHMVRSLKFGGWDGLADAMGRRMAELPWPRETEEEVRVAVPVPLSGTRLRERGFNQAERLARSVAQRRGWTCAPGLLHRSRVTDMQATLHATDRRANVAGAFGVPRDRHAELRGQHLLVVDDVWTTGATALACCAALLSAGARAVSVLTFARAIPDRRG